MKETLTLSNALNGLNVLFNSFEPQNFTFSNFQISPSVYDIPFKSVKSDSIGLKFYKLFSCFLEVRHS